MIGPLRVAIATAERFHVLGLARELTALGYAVDFYSYVPNARAQRFGLPSACHRSLLPFALPALASDRFVPAIPAYRKGVDVPLRQWNQLALDWLTLEL